jgi:Glycosyl transferase family 2
MRCVGSPAAIDTPSVAIVIDNYNYGRYLVAAVESALAQSYDAVRVIVVDDGSTDESREILPGYADRVQLVFKENGGQASAFNAGFTACREDIVIFLDSDDVLLPDAAGLVADRFAREPALVKVQYRLEVIDEAGRATGEVKPEPHLVLPQGDMRQAELAFGFDLVWLATSGNAFRREGVAQLFPIPEERFRLCADRYLVHLAALLGPVASLDSVGGRYRVHGANSYEPQSSVVSVENVRNSVDYATEVSVELERVADRIGLTRSPGPILSVADIANRLISLRLDPAQHPRRDDTRWGLLVAGIRATSRRADVRLPLRVLYDVWFLAMSVAPEPVVTRLAGWFLYPSRRRGLNALLGRLHRG